MKSYIYETIKLSDGRRYVRKYTPAEGLVSSILMFLVYLFIIWPLELFVWWPLKLLFKGILILVELILRGIWWLIKLPFCMIFTKKTPKF